MKDAKKTIGKKVKRILLKIPGEDFNEIKRAKIVFEHTINSVNRFYELFQNRDGIKGSTTHTDQDLLRAMLVFSCSGLDAVVKQLIKDALPIVIDKELGAQQEFQKFIERRIKRNGVIEGQEKYVIDVNWIASILANSVPRDYLICELQKNLQNDSLQSQDQLLKAAAHFAVTKSDILQDPETTKKAFEVRNEIIHEMDADFGGQKKRRQRSTPKMVKYCKNILKVGSNFIEIIIQKKLSSPTTPTISK